MTNSLYVQTIVRLDHNLLCSEAYFSLDLGIELLHIKSMDAGIEQGAGCISQHDLSIRNVQKTKI